MKTDDLIRLLVADTPVQRWIFPDLLWMAFLPVLVTGTVYLWFAGIRPDLFAAFLELRTVWKWVLPLLVATAGIALAFHLARPGAHAGRWGLLLWLAVSIAVWLVGGRLVILSPDQWVEAAKGKTLVICLISIVGIGLPGLIATLLVLQRGATTRPTLTGMAAGLGCAGASTVVYALHCTEDDPLFFVTWYGSAIGLLGLAGALLGARMLRW